MPDRTAWKAEEEGHTANLPQGTDKNRIQHDHFWDFSHNLEMVFTKRKDNLGPRDWNEHRTCGHWSGFRKLLRSPERRLLMSILKDETERA